MRSYRFAFSPLRRTGICAFALLATAGLTQPAAQTPVLLRLKFRVGDVSKYKLTMELTSGLPAGAGRAATSSPVISSSLISQSKVTKTLPNGSAEIATTVLSGTIDQNMIVHGVKQAPLTVKNQPPVTMVMTPQGNITAMRGVPEMNQSAALNKMMSRWMNANLQSYHLPPQPVRPGAVWTSRFALEGVSGKGVTRSRFAGMGDVGHYRTARIHASTTVPLTLLLTGEGQPTLRATEAAMRMTGAMTMNSDYDLALTDGKLIRMAATGSVAMTLKPIAPPQKSSAATQPLRMTMKMHMGNELVQE